VSWFEFDLEIVFLRIKTEKQSNKLRGSSGMKQGPMICTYFHSLETKDGTMCSHFTCRWQHRHQNSIFDTLKWMSFLKFGLLGWFVK